MATPTAQSSVTIDAPADVVYDLVSDVTRAGEWAAETTRGTWLGDATGSAVGARFRGHNKHRGRPWSTTCVVTAAEPGRAFEFRVGLAGVRTALWRYEIEPTESGCRVTESTTRLVPKAATVPLNLLALGIRDRDKHNQANIEKTLAKLKTYAETAAANR